MQLQNQGIDVKRLFNQDTIPMLKERSRPEAIDRIKRTLALGEVAKRESIKVEPEEVTTKATELLAELGDRDIDPDRLQMVVAEDLLKEKIVGWLIEHSTIELVPEGTLVKPEEEEEEALEAATVEAEATDPNTVDVSASVVDVTASVVEPTTAVEPATENTESIAIAADAETDSATEPATPETVEDEKPKKTRKATKAKAESSSDE
jgi:trigger factor